MCYHVISLLAEPDMRVLHTKKYFLQEIFGNIFDLFFFFSYFLAKFGVFYKQYFVNLNPFPV